MRNEPDEDDEDAWQDEYDDDEYDDHMIACPRCGKAMLEDAEYCPGCEQWITSEDIPHKGHSWWVVAVILILIATFALSILSIR